LLAPEAGRQHLVARIGRRAQGALLGKETRVSYPGLGLAGLMEMVVDGVKVSQVIKILEDSITEIKDEPVESIAPGSFGSLPAATDLGHHTTLARDTVLEALEDVLSGLRVYADNVESYRKDAFGIDEEVSTANVAPLQVATDCIGGGFADQNNESAPQCVVPGGSDER
jgi:hypothetical protein